MELSNSKIVDDLETETKDGISNIPKYKLDKIRILFNSLLTSHTPSVAISMMYNRGIVHVILPELHKCYGFDQKKSSHNMTVYNHIMSVVDNVEPKLELRLAALLHDIGKPQTFRLDCDGKGHFDGHDEASTHCAKSFMVKMGYDEQITSKVLILVRHHMSRYNNLRCNSLIRFIYEVGEYNLRDLFKLQIADAISKNPPFNLDDLFRLKFDCYHYLRENKLIDKNKLAITEKDLVKAGVFQKDSLDVLYYILVLVQTKRCKNRKDDLLLEVKKHIRRSNYGQSRSKIG
jgi:tRNA nucleotidyltransferase (CCA-adding enzyme)